MCKPHLTHRHFAAKVLEMMLSFDHVNPVMQFSRPRAISLDKRSGLRDC